MAQLDNDKIEAGDAKPLGLAGNIAKTFIHSPLSPLLLIACLALGLMGLALTPRQEDPQISVPIADIFFKFPGASSKQVSTLATDPLERMMSEIPGVRHVYSASEHGQGMVTVQFKVGEELGPSLVKLYDKLESNKDKMPPGVSGPLVKPKGIDDVPAVTLTLWSSSVDDASIRLLALEVMQRLKEVPDTAQSFIVGGRPEEMRVEVKPERLNSFGISIDHLAQTISSANEKRSVGESEIAGKNLKVYSGRFLKHASDLESLIVGVRNGSPVYVRDVATVTEGPGDAKNIVQYYTGPAASPDMPKTTGSPAVTISIAKKVGTNGVDVADGILAKIESLKGKLIPDNVNVSVTRNYGETANNKVNELILEMLAATSVVTVLIFLFLGFRPTLVVVVVIPIIVLMTIFAAYMLNFTIDRVSLFALIFSIGILVDDATVVVENTYRRWLQKGSIDTATTIDAVREVGNPTILATLTIIAALLPMGFVSGMMGPYMRPIPVLGSVAMIFSLFAAFVFTPWLVMRIRPSLAKLRKMQDDEHRMASRLDGIIRRVLGPLLDSPKKARMFRIIIWVGLILACSMFYFQLTIVKMLPLDNKPEYNVVLNMPEGTSLPQTANVIQQMTEKVLTIKEVTAVQTYSGTASPFNFNGLVRHYYLRRQSWEGDIQIQLLDKGDRDRSSHEIAVATRALLTPLAKAAGAKIQIVEMPPGPPVLQTMVTEIYGPDAETRRQVARDMTKIFEKAEGVVDVDNLLSEPHDIWVFEVDQQKAEHRNVSIASMNRQLSMVMGGHKLGDVKKGAELEPRFIILQAPLDVRGQISNLGEMPIMTRAGKMVTLGELGKFVKSKSEPVIYHKDLRPVEFVTGEVAGKLAAPVYGMLNVSSLLNDYTTPDGVVLKSNFLGFSGYMLGPPKDGFKTNFEWTGEWTVTYETFRDMGLAFMAALIMIYMLIVVEFGNFRLPGIIMAPIPLTLLGIIPGHWLLGAEFTATSMIGWIALAGIIVRNSILLVDFSKQAVAEGMDAREAVIQAVRTRTRPILITQGTMIAGSLGIIFDPIFQGMAISLLFGAIVATVLTLVVIPLSCFQAPGAYRSANDTSPMPTPAGGSGPVMTAASAQQKKKSAKQKSDKLGLLARLFGLLGTGVLILKIIPLFGWEWIKAVAEKLAQAVPAVALVWKFIRDLPFKILEWVEAKTGSRKKPVSVAVSDREMLAKAIEDAKPVDSKPNKKKKKKSDASKKQRAAQKLVASAALLEQQKADKKKSAKKLKKKEKLKQAAQKQAELERARAKELEEQIRAKAAQAEAKAERERRKQAEDDNAKKMAALQLALQKQEEKAASQVVETAAPAKPADKVEHIESTESLIEKRARKKAKNRKARKLARKKQAKKLAKKLKAKKAETLAASSAKTPEKADKPAKAKKPKSKKAKKLKGPQDLKRIKGIGPKVEQHLNRLGITRYKQLAALSADDIETIQYRSLMSLRIGEGDENWITQAKILAKGGQTDFSRRVDGGKVPSSQNDNTNRDKK